MPHQVLTEAFKLVSTDRAAAHGEPKENHENIARLWDAYLHDIDHVTAHDVANMMELLKVARDMEMRKVASENTSAASLPSSSPSSPNS